MVPAPAALAYVAFVTNCTSNDIFVIDVKKEKVIKSIRTGRYPWALSLRHFRRGGCNGFVNHRTRSEMLGLVSTQANSMAEKKMIRFAALAICLLSLSAAFVATPVQAQSGLLTRAIKLPSNTLSAGEPLAQQPYELESGKYYGLSIVADGSQELAIDGPEFFRNVWVNEIVINDIEVRPLSVDSLEFDDEGEATITFIPIRPGIFDLKIPGTTGKTQRAIFNVKG